VERVAAEAVALEVGRLAVCDLDAGGVGAGVERKTSPSTARSFMPAGRAVVKPTTSVTVSWAS
jgi:hypothetical protein